MRAVSLLILFALLTACKSMDYKQNRAEPRKSTHPNPEDAPPSLQIGDLQIDTIALPDNSPITHPEQYNIILFVVCAIVLILVVAAVPISEHIESAIKRAKKRKAAKKKIKKAKRSATE